MSNRIETGWLYDFYGPLLTERQQKLLSLYCNEDFSLSEIAARKASPDRGFMMRFTAQSVSSKHMKSSLVCWHAIET